jgi:hypothetical protein
MAFGIPLPGIIPLLLNRSGSHHWGEHFACLDFTGALWGWYIHYPHYTDEKIELPGCGHSSHTWQVMELGYAPESAHTWFLLAHTLSLTTHFSLIISKCTCQECDPSEQGQNEGQNLPPPQGTCYSSNCLKFSLNLSSMRWGCKERTLWASCVRLVSVATQRRQLFIHSKII